LHHAYLFTGTRGVGKTRSRGIIAKALNCEPELRRRLAENARPAQKSMPAGSSI